jgi:very-short-patch-repair endonuclease
MSVSLNSCINYASWQNSVPFLKSLVIQNQSDQTLNNLQLEMRIEPPFARTKKWTVERINAGTEVELTDRRIELDPDYLTGLNEAERGQVTFHLYCGQTTIDKQTYDIRILARDEWGGLNVMAELLAAFVMPNDPAVAKIMKNAGEALANHGHSSALNGYQSRDPARAFMLTAAIWSAIAAENITYANPPSSFELAGQKTRRPSTIIADGLATCLDTSLLFAAVIEAIGLNSVAVFLRGHCFVGAWLVEKTFRNLIERDITEVRKAIAARELIVFETTLITGRPPSTFSDARNTAESAIASSKEDQFVAAIDFMRARMAQIRPLASHDRNVNEQIQRAQNIRVVLPLPKVPDFSQLPTDNAEEKPTTPAGRIERWQRKLLDLSLRNRLLNFKPSKQSVPLFCPNIPLLEDRLATGKNLRIVSLAAYNPIDERDPELHFQKTRKALDVEFAVAGLKRGELSAMLNSDDLTTRLTELYRTAKNDLAEGGSNTLYMAVGFLRWKKKPDDSIVYSAPLLLIPVKLLRTSVISPFHLARHDEEVRFNSTLIQMLKKDFERDLTSFETDLPTDENGVRVSLVLEKMRRVVRDIPGFEVVDETELATFSFAKYLMWKDLVDRTDQLAKNRLVKHLIENPDKPFKSVVSTPFPACKDLDRNYLPNQLVHPLPADSSQLAAIAAAEEGHDFVLIGPPGTGKSQTIANMIAQCLASRKTVLFVAEKTAALDVVYRRLRENGLGDFCLELHSNKAERRQFLDQLDASWTASQTPISDDWYSINDQLRIRRDELNRYVEALHAEDSNGWNVFRAMGVSVKGIDQIIPELTWGNSVRHDLARYNQFVDLMTEMSLTFKALGSALPPNFVSATEWSAAWEANLLRETDNLEQSTRSLQSALRMFSAEIGVAEISDLSRDDLQRFSRVARAVTATVDDDYRIVFSKHFRKIHDGLDTLGKDLIAYNSTRRQINASYDDDELNRIPTDELDRAWREANATFWPISIFAKRRVQKLLQSYANNGISDPQNDLPRIRSMQKLFDRISANPITEESHLWNGRNTDPDKLRKHLTIAKETREAIVDLETSLGSPKTVSSKLYPVLTTSSADHATHHKAQAFLESTRNFSAAMLAFKNFAEAVPVNQSTQHVISETFQAVEKIKKDRTSLKKWTAWSHIRKKAETLGLTVFVIAMESEQISPDSLPSAFELAYVRWWLPKAIDQNSVLRSFQRFQHEDAIQHFQKLDQLARAAASTHVRKSLSHNLPRPDEVPRQSELGLLRHQMQLQRPSKTIREVIGAMPASFGKLAPCLLMSPLSIAQYLPSNQALFDIVIFDEASQITTWDAIGAIARGRQTVIVGDPKQLPPTNFFGRSDNDEADDELEDHERDLESILDEAKNSGLPPLQLNWHYRSRHESLIAFSNSHYYNNQLITFPSAVTKDQAVSLKHLKNGVYDRGKSRTNRVEAEAIVSDGVARMRQCLNLPEKQRPTLGVITFNKQQQTLVQNLFDEARRIDPEIDWFFNDERIEPTVVKNLENVQGDERDVMLFSIAFGPNQSGKIPLSFGALNRNGGERRLNVAVTRARQELVVYSSFKADQLNVEKTKSTGVKDLKNFLDYADRGAIALAAEQTGSMGGFDSPFEEAVADRLSAKGWQIVTQIGVSGFRIDLGVVNPEKPGAYLAGIECDGATYHRSATARDRDKIREEILRNLGWEIIRIWSPDWWYDCVGATEHVHQLLCGLVEASRNKEESIDDDAPSPDVEEEGVVQDAPSGNLLVASLQVDDIQLAAIEIDTNAFLAPEYTEKLREVIMTILKVESPIRADMLAQRVLRYHKLSRMTSKIRERISTLTEDVYSTKESTGRFLWASSAPVETTVFRYSKSEDEKRSVDQIAIAELCGLIISQQSDLIDSDPARAIARRIGIDRLTTTSRERIQEAIDAALRLISNPK